MVVPHERAAVGNGQVARLSTGALRSAGADSVDSARPEPGSQLPCQAWDQVTANFGEMKEFASSVKSRVSKVMQRHTNTYIRKIPQELMEIEATIKAQLDLAKFARRTRCGVDPDDPDFPRAVALEEKLAECTERACHLHKLCAAYHEEAGECRAKVKALLETKESMGVAAREALRSNQLISSVAEPLTARGRATPPALWLTDLLPPPSAGACPSSSSRAGTRRSLPSSRGSSRGAAATAATAAAAAAAPPLTARESTSRASVKSAGVGLPPPMSQASTRAGSTRPNTAAMEGGRCSLGAPLGRTSSPSEGPSSASAPLRPSTALCEGGIDKTPAVPFVFCPLPKFGNARLKGSGTMMDSWEESYANDIKALEAQLRDARRTTRELKASTATGFCKRGELEEFFLLCMHDFREASKRQRGVANAAAAAGRSLTPGRGSRQGERTLTAFDKILKVMAESDEFNMLLYERLFPHRQACFKNRRPPAPVVRNAVGALAGSGSVGDADLLLSATAASGMLWEQTCDNAFESLDLPSIIVRRGGPTQHGLVAAF